MECPSCGASLVRGNRKVINSAISHESVRTRQYRCLQCDSVNYSVEVLLDPEHVERDKGKYPKYHIKKDVLIPLLKTLYGLR